MTAPILHVAAMPFPSPQGTQAAVRSMLEALAAAGHDVHLATYAHGTTSAASAHGTTSAASAHGTTSAASAHGTTSAASAHGTTSAASAPTHAAGRPYTVHRIPDFPRDRSLRSGPSARKLALDASLAVLVARLMRELRPSLVVAHHAEAMLAALAARARPLVYVAHTALGPELPAYLGPLSAPLGTRLDRFLVRHADVACAVSPSLSLHLSTVAQRRVESLPIPWPPSRDGGSRGKENAAGRVEESDRENDPVSVRRSMGIAEGERVILYAGNLDAYQGLATLFAAADLLAPVRLLVATESDARALPRSATVVPLATERDRARAHAAVDVVVVPRALPGGVPVKLLDALCRGVPVVAARRATGDLPLGDAALVVTDDDPEALAVGVRLVLATPSTRAALVAAGRTYVEREHSAARFVEVFERLAADV